MFQFFKRKAADLFTIEQKERIVNAVKTAELQTSGEVRIFIESKCRFVNPIDRAKEIFDELNMYNTAERNAVLVYIAMSHRQLAIYGDVGIYQKTGATFWNEQVKTMISHFNSSDYVEGICEVVLSIGDALATHFPYDKVNDVNELPDDIVFGI
ncbi:TPM domain-containing protein [Parasediminibacterium paludis]|uniref:TPM domain-containing protein n=1 Tax=Parasediminibacterium paludis TaxID=908966 RepID=A0ABV8PRL0_9BACT